MKDSYDVIGDIYNKYWGDFTKYQFTNIEDLVLYMVPPYSHVLDVCCGTGTIAALLTERGYAVEGVDISKKMIHYARLNAPKATFHVGDARTYTSDKPFDLVISTLDSFNLIGDSDCLRKIFINVHQSLKPGGIFYFDIRNQTGYEKYWDKSCINIIDTDSVAAFNCQYDKEAGIGLMRCSYFSKNEDGTYNREEVYMPHTSFTEEEITKLLQDSGFEHITLTRRKEGTYTQVEGRTHYLCRKNSNSIAN